MENIYMRKVIGATAKLFAVLLSSTLVLTLITITEEVYAQTVKKPSAVLPGGAAQARFNDALRMTNKSNVYQVLMANRVLVAEEKLAIAAVRQLPQNTIDTLKPGSGGDPRASGKLGGAVDEAAGESDSSSGATSAVGSAMQESKTKTELRKAIEGAREPVDPKPMLEPLARELGIDMRSINVETFRTALARAARVCGPTCNR